MINPQIIDKLLVEKNISSIRDDVAPVAGFDLT